MQAVHRPGRTAYANKNHAVLPREGPNYSLVLGLADCLRPGGVFGLWSAWKPSDKFLGALAEVFASMKNLQISFFNPHVNETDSNWVIIATLEDSYSAGGVA